jgi:hypothetical protein
MLAQALTERAGALRARARNPRLSDPSQNERSPHRRRKILNPLYDESDAGAGETRLRGGMVGSVQRRRKDSRQTTPRRNGRSQSAVRRPWRAPPRSQNKERPAIPEGIAGRLHFHDGATSSVSRSRSRPRFYRRLPRRRAAMPISADAAIPRSAALGSGTTVSTTSLPSPPV